MSPYTVIKKEIISFDIHHYQNIIIKPENEKDANITSKCAERFQSTLAIVAGLG
jgi:hypothetical protein